MMKTIITFIVVSVLHVADVVVSVNYESDEESGQRIRAQKDAKFWDFIHQEKEALDEREDVFQRALDIARTEENLVIKDYLKEIVERVRNAATVVFWNDAQLKDIAEQSAESLVGVKGSFGFGFGQNFLASVYDNLTGQQTQNEVDQDILRRQELLLPFLEVQASRDLGNVMDNCRKATSKAFDLLKFDLYQGNKELKHRYPSVYKSDLEKHEKLPKTSDEAKEIANKLIDLSTTVRRRYTRSIIDLANGLANDVSQRENLREKVDNDSIHQKLLQLPTGHSSGTKRSGTKCSDEVGLGDLAFGATAVSSQQTMGAACTDL